MADPALDAAVDATKGAAGSIAVGIDGSPASEAALRWAVDEAARRNATVRAIIVWEYPGGYGTEGTAALIDPVDMERAALADLDQTLVAACPDSEARSRIERIVRAGSPARVLVEASEGAEMLVVGARGRGGFLGLLMGSVATQVARHAVCTTVVVPFRDAE